MTKTWRKKTFVHRSASDWLNGIVRTMEKDNRVLSSHGLELLRANLELIDEQQVGKPPKRDTQRQTRFRKRT